ncbi:lasso peptide biosynthesis B2 protein [Spirillospora sp. NPDC029432]|uniref:lasso peptide biosynthesis B2 protein n=1 Tax=Spirillospora sp. NPDC029432 TaxID=3154599 RepID=UPI003453DB73
MSVRVVLEERGRVGLGRRIAARTAVAAARGLVRLPPWRLRRVLEAARRGARPATVDEAAAARRAVVAVSVLCAGQGCLPRSVATALLCRLGGSWPDWCTGVLTEPFRAHAWVEAEGVPVGEDTGHYHKVMTVPARGDGR